MKNNYSCGWLWWLATTMSTAIVVVWTALQWWFFESWDDVKINNFHNTPKCDVNINAWNPCSEFPFSMSRHLTQCNFLPTSLFKHYQFPYSVMNRCLYLNGLALGSPCYAVYPGPQVLSIANEHTMSDTKVIYPGPNNPGIDLTDYCGAGPRELAEPTLLYGDIGLTGYELHVWRVHVAVLLFEILLSRGHALPQCHVALRDATCLCTR